MNDLFSKSLSLALTGALLLQSSGAAFAAKTQASAPSVSEKLEALKKDAKMKAFWEQFAFEDEYMLGRLDAAGYQVFETELKPVAEKWAAGDVGPGQEFAYRWKTGLRKNAQTLVLALDKRKLQKTFTPDEYQSLKTFEKARPGVFGKFSAEYAKHKKNLGAAGEGAAAVAARNFVMEWRNRMKAALGDYTKTEVAQPAKPDPLAKLFPDEKERGMVRCFSGLSAFEGTLDSAKLRADTALNLQKRLLGQAPAGALSQECSKISADELKAYYCRFEPAAGEKPGEALQKLAAQCSDQRFERLFPDATARAVLQCLDPAKAFMAQGEAKAKEFGQNAVTAAKLALDKTAKDKLGVQFKDKKDEDRAMSCVKDLGKSDALLDFYCANESKPDEKSPLAAKCAERRAAKLFADPADYAVYQCLGPKDLLGDLQKDASRKDAVMKAWGTAAAGKAQLVLTGSNDTAKLSKPEKDCLLGKGLGKDKLRDFYCRYQPADAQEPRQTATGAMDQGKVSADLSQGPGETVEFDNSGRKQGTLVAAGGKATPLQELNQYCSDKRKEQERTRPIPGRGLTINEPAAGPVNRNTEKDAQDAKNKELMDNLKKDAIAGAYGAVGFGLIGFIFGGPVGAVIGAMIGFAAMGAVTHLSNNPPGK